MRYLKSLGIGSMSQLRILSSYNTWNRYIVYTDNIVLVLSYIIIIRNALNVLSVAWSDANAHSQVCITNTCILSFFQYYPKLRVELCQYGGEPIHVHKA